MKKIVNFSKPYNDIFSLKKDLYQNNDGYLKKILNLNKLYAKQKKRKFCKNCNFKLNKKDFTSRLVSYTLCLKCGHLNGLNEDSKKFVDFVYNKNEGKNYYPNYNTNYKKRIKSIYKPKIEFLKKIIKKKINIIEIGSGGGHLLKACETMGIPATGFETNRSLIDLGNKYLSKNKLKYTDMNEITSKILHSKANTLVMMSVLEHLQKPNEILKAFRKSKLEYLFISVPLFSMAVIFENIFQKIYPRVLGGAHTHLYTEKSLNYLAKKNNLNIIGEWWFGADIPDLFRMLINSSNKFDKKYVDIIYQNFGDMCNSMQTIIDKKKFCAQVHMVMQKK